MSGDEGPMYVSGTEYASEIASGNLASAKMVFNARGALLFPASEQHRDQKAVGISYEDDYKGNALAAMLSSQRIEIRFHNNFSDAQVANIIRSMTQYPSLTFIREWQVTYQGRELAI